VAVTRRTERVELPDRPGARDIAYRFASLDYPATERRFNCYYAEFLPGDPENLRSHEHAGVEFIYVVQGTLSIHMNAEAHTLRAGDAIYFDAAAPHAYRRVGARTCCAVVVTAS
jgi:quercetin dioxygenase-like cupin family protein